MFVTSGYSDLGGGVGDHVRTPDEREDSGELLRPVQRRQPRADRHHHELEDGPERRDEQAIRPREDAVHHARLRPVERRRQESIRIVEREEDPAGDDGVEKVVLQEHRREPWRLVGGHARIEVEEAGHPERDEAAPAADHVDDANAPLGVASHELADIERPAHARGKGLPALLF